jgi:hypothetical protein
MFRQVRDPHLLQAAADNEPVAFGRPVQPALVAVTSHHHHIPDCDREAPVHFLTLRDIGHAVLVVAQLPAMDQDPSLLQRQDPHQRLEQCGFACSVGTHHSHARAVRHLEAEVLQDDFFAVADIGVLDFESMRGLHAFLR